MNRAGLFSLPVEHWAGGALPANRRRGTWSTHYIDVSNNNGLVDYRAVAAGSKHTGITGVAMKATEGTTFVDPYFVAGRATAAAYGLRVQAYHFARPNEHPGLLGALEEARHFCAVVKRVAPDIAWRPMLDFETPPFDAAWARAWLNEVRRTLGVAPMIYSYFAALAGMGLRKPIGDGLVLAYPNGLPQSAPVPSPWRKWTAHQYSWTGRVAGVQGDVDMNWTPAVWSMLANPARGFAAEPMMKRRRGRA